MNIGDKNRPITVEDLIRRYGLENLKSDRKTMSYISNTLTRQQNIIRDFISNVTPYKSQTDKLIVWFFSGIPTLLNKPYIDFSETDKQNSHLYYDRESGNVYQLQFNQVNQDYYWQQVSDDNLIKSLAIANSDSDTLDSKRVVFYSSPSIPYDVGDIWVDDELKRCRYARSDGEAKDIDWGNLNEYSNDYALTETGEILNNFMATVNQEYVKNIEVIQKINQSIETVKISDNKLEIVTFIGSGTTDSNGYLKIDIDSSLVNKDYKVFIQKNGSGDFYVIKSSSYFEVFGEPSMNFDWLVKYQYAITSN